MWHCVPLFLPMWPTVMIEECRFTKAMNITKNNSKSRLL
ncbi:hypothetical protein Q7O_000316 [Pectobacterium carotovorum subsp. carotovorum PCCS1]|nr:hypothetical protein [Pectobacterium carotovorum subsp. carotovorum PCCS1]